MLHRYIGRAIEELNGSFAFAGEGLNKLLFREDKLSLENKIQSL